MHQFHHGLLPTVYDDCFIPVSQLHTYTTRLASKSSYYLPQIRTNYGKFNKQFNSLKVCNVLENSIKSVARFSFESCLKQEMINRYC